jgi:hypothetical protein
MGYGELLEREAFVLCIDGGDVDGGLYYGLEPTRRWRLKAADEGVVREEARLVDPRAVSLDSLKTERGRRYQY